jgi:hypothetical protein
MNNLEIEEPEFQDKWDYTGEKEAEWEEAKRLRIRSGNTLDESLPKQEPRWIPFSERLPEHGQWVSIHCIDDTGRCAVLQWHPCISLWLGDYTAYWFPVPPAPLFTVSQYEQQ